MFGFPVLFQHSLINGCSPGKFKNGVNGSRPKCGNILPEFLKLLTRKTTKKPQELPMIRGSMRRQGPRMGLKYDEEKGMICECAENKQILAAQNVLNSNRFIYGCTS